MEETAGESEDSSIWHQFVKAYAPFGRAVAIAAEEEQEEVEEELLWGTEADENDKFLSITANKLTLILLFSIKCQILNH